MPSSLFINNILHCNVLRENNSVFVFVDGLLILDRCLFKYLNIIVIIIIIIIYTFAPKLQVLARFLFTLTIDHCMSSFLVDFESH